ncbi:protein-serine/threonine phosphatase [Ranunculus cassubicifolius]
MSGRNHSTGRPRYKLNNSIVSFLKEQRHDDTYFRSADDTSYISKNSLHCSLSDEINLKELYVAERLRTILILHKPRSFFNQVPRDLFLKLPLLRALDLSHTNITELPSSIGNLKDLVYLNLSGTPITALPTSLCCLYQMQTLKLRGCIKLLSLPEDMRKLRYLHHLDVDVACLLLWMPPGLGDLTSLRTLPAFVVGKEKGCGITELEHMAMLSGNLAILRLENVSSSDEAKEATLDRKILINKLELQWTELQDGYMLLENLQPHEDIRELEIVGYGGVKFPSWIGDPIFSSLTILNIHSCTRCKFLPPLGKLPSLRCLSISGMHSVRRITGEFCDREMVADPLENVLVKKVTRQSRSGNKFTAFPQLRNLTLHRMQILEKWSGVEEDDFPSLQELTISGCPKLTDLPAVSVFKSLHQLEISMCPLIESFPKEGLPTSLQCLVVIDCPLLKKQLHKKNGRESGMLAHIPCAWIDYEQVSKRPEQVRLSNSTILKAHS